MMEKWCEEDVGIVVDLGKSTDREPQRSPFERSSSIAIVVGY